MGSYFLLCTSLQWISLRQTVGFVKIKCLLGFTASAFIWLPKYINIILKNVLCIFFKKRIWHIFPFHSLVSSWLLKLITRRNSKPDSWTATVPHGITEIFKDKVYYSVSAVRTEWNVFPHKGITFRCSPWTGGYQLKDQRFQLFSK